MSRALLQHLLAASSAALRLCGNTDWSTSYEIHKRATPIKMMWYKHAMKLHRLYSSTDGRDNWIDLNLQQNLNSRNGCVNLVDSSKLRVGKNIMLNWLTAKNNQISYGCLNLSFESYKIKRIEMLLFCSKVELTKMTVYRIDSSKAEWHMTLTFQLCKIYNFTMK